jgi:hypothetical protein
MVEDKYVLIPSTTACYLTIASYGFFFGRLRVPTRRCDLVVPADWGWGRSNYRKSRGIRNAGAKETLTKLVR